MNLFKNLITCSSSDDKLEDVIKDLEKVEYELMSIKKDINLFQVKINEIDKFNNKFFADLNKLEARLEAKFDNLSSKIDTILLYIKH